MKKPRTQNGPNWAVKFKKTAPNQPGMDDTKGKKGYGSPEKDLKDRLGEAMANLKTH